MPPPKVGDDFKRLFRSLASAGAGRPIDDDGFPEGPWTADLLSEAITQIDVTGSGVDLRTVQIWFQDNDKGISTDNIRWLARVFGCDDPEATSQWQASLSAAQSLLASKRRDAREMVQNAKIEAHKKASITASDFEAPETKQGETMLPLKQRFSLAKISEAFFSHPSPLNLPATVFAGAIALGFLSYFLGIHSVTYDHADGFSKQVGFIWAPNWTILFMVLMPLNFAFVGELIVVWKTEARPMLQDTVNRFESDNGWGSRVEASTYTFWAALVLCLAVAGLLQWFGVRLVPLVTGYSDYTTDWGSLAIVRPEVISVPQAAAFTGLAYLYMCLVFYVYFVGLILLYTLADDMWKLRDRSTSQVNREYSRKIDGVSFQVMRGIFRCTILGIMIAICMKLQSIYLTSNAESIVVWLLRDLKSVLQAVHVVTDELNYSMPTHYSSLLIAMSSCVVFIYSSVRFDRGAQLRFSLTKMNAIVVVLLTGYFLIGSFSGFSVLLGVAVTCAIYGLFVPGFGTRQPDGLEDRERVP